MTFRYGPTHKNVRASVRWKGTSCETRISAHHTITWETENRVAVKVKVFSADKIEISMNGTAEMSLDELIEIKAVVFNYVKHEIEG